MPDTPSAVPLRLEYIDQAYPIVQAQFPAIPLEEWRQYAARLIGPGDPTRGVMTAQHAGYIRGLFCHWPDRSLEHGDMLVVENFTVLDLFDPRGVARALIDAMDAIAALCRCSAIHTVLPDHRPTPLHGHLQAKGHHLSSVVLCKPLLH